jgi:hypothetical protein
MAGMPEMQEHFPAGHGWPVSRKCRSNFRDGPWMAGIPEMQEHFPGRPWMAGMPEMQEHFPGWPLSGDTAFSRQTCAVRY